MIKRLLLKLIGVKFWLALALLVAGVVDILSTFPMVRFETNPIYFFVGKSTFFLVIIKFLMIGFLIRFLYIKQKTDFKKYFSIVIIVLGIMGMLFASVNNLYTSYGINEYEVRTGEKVMPASQYEQMVSYLVFIVIIFFYPLIVCISSFLIHKKIKKKEDEPIIEVLK